MSSETPALAAYGTLAPGEHNHHVVAGLRGTWLPARLRGHRWDWEDGPYAGLPALALSPDGPTVTVNVLISDDLDDQWERLDTFEGPGYRRTTTEVVYDSPEAAEAIDAPTTVWVYEALRDYTGTDGVGPA